MQFTTSNALLAIATAAFSVQALPFVPRQDSGSMSNVTDADVLNYALTLEHLENTFYSQSLAQFDDQAFADAGYPAWVRKRFTQVAAHEKTHVEALTGALQAANITAVQACEYNFGITDVATFVATSGTVEAIGSSAYTGAAQFVSDKGYLTVAASILAIEARHSSWVSGAVESQNSWGTAFETVLSLNQVYTLASPFFTSCPDGNPTLPVKAFPALTATLSSSTASVSYEGSDSAEGDMYAALLIGLAPTYLSVNKGDDGSMTVDIPADVTCGPAYLIITNQNGTVSDDATVAGPAVLRLPCNSDGQTTM